MSYRYVVEVTCGFGMFEDYETLETPVFANPEAAWFNLTNGGVLLPTHSKRCEVYLHCTRGREITRKFVCAGSFDTLTKKGCTLR